jgi:DNA polymerase-1
VATKKSSAKSASAVETNTASERKPVLPQAEKGRVFLIDSMSFIFRAYHAMARQRPMSTRTGVPTSATYVFVNMLNKLRKDFAPEYIAAVFDLPEPTFRDEQAKAMPPLRRRDKSGEVVETVYEGYKANRSEMPADLSQQVPYIRRALDAYRIPILAVPGWEADDVIGTLARKAAADSFGVYVVSSDKDMLQLVGENVCVLNPPKDNLICDSAKVEELLGVPPECVVDLMALRGDSIDNIPGAPGIGEKGSTELIQKFGSLDALLERAEEVEKKTYRQSLVDNREMILLSRRLAAINQEVEIGFEPEAMKAQAPDVIAARDLFTELEFTSLVKEFLAEGVEVGKTDYRRAESASDIDALLASGEDTPLALAIDAAMSATAAATASEAEPADNGDQLSLTASLVAAETATAKPHDIGLSSAKGSALVAAFDSGALGDKLASLLSDADISKAVHDSKAALKTLRAAGVEPRAKNLYDTMLYSYLLDPTYSTQALGDVALRRLGLKLTGDLAEAADVTGRLAAMLREEVETAGLTEIYNDIDLPLVPVLAGMEETGVKIDCDVLAAMSKRLQSECDRVAARIFEAAGVEFNINSPRQLGDVLFNKMGLRTPVKYGKGKTISTAQDVLEGLAGEHEVPKLVLEYRQLSKLKSTYVDALPVLCRVGTGRVHTTFNHASTATGRLSSTNPNLQNIPIRTELGREIRAAFVAEPGHVLLAADYSQIELRLLAHYSEDELLVEAYRRGDDIHTLTAAQVFGVPPMLIDAEHRRRAKAVNFGIVYGLSPFGLAQQLGIEQKEAKRFIESYFEKYAGVRRFIDATLEQARQEGKVRTLFGRVRPIPDINSRNPNNRGFAERTAVNTPLQGTAADLIKLAMIRIDRDLREQRLKTRMLLQVHDELVFEAPQDEVETVRALVKDRMENVSALRVPLVVEIGVGPNWRDMD